VDTWPNSLTFIEEAPGGGQTPLTLERFDALHLATGLVWRHSHRGAHGLSSWTLGFDAGGAAQAAAQVGTCPARTRWR
jgi:hypothetical protein